MATATEKWSPRRFTKAAAGAWSAVREFNIIEASSEADAYAATLTSTDLGTTTGKVPVFNEAHPSNTLLKADNLDLSYEGFNLYRLTVNYSIPTNGSHEETTDDLLSKPMRIRWRQTIQVEQFDVDKDGNPIVNSAGDAFLTPQDRDILNLIVEFTRYEPFYDLSKFQIYSNTVNSDTWTVPGLFTIPPGKAKLNTYQPTDDYTLTDDYVQVVYEVELRDDGFESRHLDEGPRANAAGGERVRCYSAAGELLDRVLLAGNGLPIDTTIRLGDGNLTRLARAVPAGATAENTGAAYFLRYKRYKATNFSGLGLA